MFWIKLGLVSHALAAGALTGAVTHFALVLRHAARGRPYPRLQRLYPAVALACFGVVYVLGSVIYPTYRVDIRAAWLDDHAPWMSVLFDLKENLATLLAPLLATMAVLARTEDPAKPSRVLRWASFAVLIGVWFDLVVGLLVVSTRSV